MIVLVVTQIKKRILEALRLRTLHPGSLLPKQRRVTTISRYLIAKVQIKMEIKKNLARKIVVQ